MNPIAEASRLYDEGIDAHKRGDIKCAHEHFMRCVELNSECAPYRLNLALASEELSRLSAPLNDMAYFQASEAVRLAPDVLGNLWGFAQVALSTHHYKEAIHGYEQCTRLAPDNAALWCVLGFTHLKLDHMEEAERCLLRSVDIDPELGQAHFLLSTIYTNERHDDAKIAFHGERAFTAKNKASLSMEAMWNAAHGFLGIACYEKGWGYFESRLYRNLTNTGRKLLSEKFSKPMWKGERDCRVLVFCEMGLGDAACLARYFPVIEKQFGVEVSFECYPQMAALMRHSFPSVKVVDHGNEADFDYHLPIMSLPFICKTRADSVPWDGAYLKAEPAKIIEWENRLCGLADHSRANVGICWSTGANIYNPQNYDVHRKKSVPFDNLKPLLDTPGVNFISLQTGDEARLLPNPGIESFSDTAAILHHLDLVITPDTALANLSGAMGKKTWLMDRMDADWRYLKTLKTPWYPSVRVFRQTKLYDWSPVIRAITDEMRSISKVIVT